MFMNSCSSFIIRSLDDIMSGIGEYVFSVLPLCVCVCVGGYIYMNTYSCGGD